MASPSNRLRVRFARTKLALCVSALVTTSLVSAPTLAQSAHSTPRDLGPTFYFLNAGGPYEASAYGSFVLLKAANRTDNIATDPEVTIHFEAGAWGSRGNEPMVFMYVKSLFDVAGEANYLYPANPTAGYARVPCTAGVDPHCECIHPDPNECYHYTVAAASVRKPYRLVNTSGMMLPGDISFIPVLVDYRAHLVTTKPFPLPNDQALFNLTAQVRLAYPDGQATFWRAINCSAHKCVSHDEDPAPSTGTFPVPVSLRAAEDLLLDVSGAIYVNDRPTCATVPTLPNDPCLVPPYSGEAWVHVDPYVYVDPSWEYADWFEVQTTADEAGTEWVAAKRTTIDLSKFGLGGGGAGGLPDPGPDAGAGGTGGAAGAVGSGGSPGTGGGSGPSNTDGGGCAVANRSPASESNLALLVLFAAAAIRRRRR